MNKPAIALAVVGASLAVFQAFGPARSAQTPSRPALYAQPAPGAAAAPGGYAANMLVPLSQVASLQPGKVAIMPGASPFGNPLPDAPTLPGPAPDTVQPLDDLAAVTPAPAGPPAGDPWEAAANAVSPPGFDQVVTLPGAAAGAATPGTGGAAGGSLGPGAPGDGTGLPGANAGDFGAGPFVSAVPDPASWATLLAGLALVGINLRRRGPRSVLS